MCVCFFEDGFHHRRILMLWTIIVVLLVLWALGFGGVYGAGIGPLFHVLIVVAIVVLILQLVRGRRV